ncbi:hypothetical protein JRO89_XS15G0128300 [Xanthoceras sorbifolium]|uniref:Retrotransposon Copia-like N-terminal domain-containing protein n=1 Tax=Xanthoceras sorbifolium TaxID=99658 RepID=A0ABQ8H1W8_9ROSI|nr:hypothetical protein JRO89_XS15G0128300 [Xanthoceras sorbifolium]
MANDEVPSTPPSNSGKTAASSGSSKPEISSNSSKSDISNPYFTHHSDHSGLVLVSKSLNEDNYAGWKKAMTLALNSKNKLGFVNRSIEAPSKEADPEGYATCTIQSATELGSAAMAVRLNNNGGKSNFSAGTDRPYQSPANRSSQPHDVRSQGE